MSPDRTRALYIGRFQTLHLGHTDVLSFITSAPDIDELLLVLGSTQYDHTNKSPVAPWSANPFTAAERQEMLGAALAELSLHKPVSVHEVPDYHDWERWYAHIVDHLPPFRVLYTADRHERDFFAAKGLAVRTFPRVRSFHAGAIRDMIATGQDGWREMVPQTTAVLLDRFGAGERLRELAQRDALSSR